MLIFRRNKTVIYNVDTDGLRTRLARALAELGLDFVANSNRLVIAPAEAFTVTPAPGTEAITAEPGVTVPTPAAPTKSLHAMPGGPRYAELTIDTFRPMCHVTLHWEHYELLLRREIEEHLARALEDATAPDNPAAAWFLGFSGLVFGTITMLAAFFIVVLWRR
jgi:hypothetical protein